MAMQRASFIALTTLPGSIPAVVFENELKEHKLKVTAVTCERKLVKLIPGTWERTPDEVEITLNLANAIVRSWIVTKKPQLDTSLAAVSEDAAWAEQNKSQKELA